MRAATRSGANDAVASRGTSALNRDTCTHGRQPPTPGMQRKTRQTPGVRSGRGRSLIDNPGVVWQLQVETTQQLHQVPLVAEADTEAPMPENPKVRCSDFQERRSLDRDRGTLETIRRHQK